jgi:hypothetical protein
MLTSRDIMARTALAFALVAGLASVASAGTYVGLGIGTPVATSGDTDLAEGGRSGRLQLGWSFGRFAVEGLVGRAELQGWGYSQPVTFTSLGVAGKYNIPLQDRFEVFGRLGWQHTMLDVSNDPVHGDDSYAGNGVLVGAGVEYKIILGVAGGSLFLDYSIERADLSYDRDPNAYGMSARVWTVGATLSF